MQTIISIDITLRLPGPGLGRIEIGRESQMIRVHLEDQSDPTGLPLCPSQNLEGDRGIHSSLAIEVVIPVVDDRKGVTSGINQHLIDNPKGFAVRILKQKPRSDLNYSS